MKMFNILIRKKVFRDILNEKIGIISFKFFGFLLTIFLARFLGPKYYGVYTVTLSIAFLLSLFLNFGIPTAILRYLPKFEEKEKILSFLIKVQIVLCAVSFIVLFFLASKFSIVFFKNIKYQIFALFSIFLAILISFRRTFSSIFQSKKRFDIVRNLLIFEGLSKLIFIIPLVLFLGLIGSVLGFALAYIFLIILSLFYLKKLNIKIFRIREKISEKLEILKYLFLVNISNISRFSYGWIDSIIISSLLDFKSVGFYRVSNAIVFSLLGLTGLQSIFAPRISKWNLEKIKKNLPKIFLLNLSITFPIFLGLIFFGKILIEILYGSEYLIAYDLLKVLSLVLILNSFSYFTLIFDLKGKPEYSVLTILIMTLVNALLDYFLILKIGLIGSVWATVIAWIVSLSFAGIIFKLRFKDKL